MKSARAFLPFAVVALLTGLTACGSSTSTSGKTAAGRSTVRMLTAETFISEIEDKSGLAVVDFWATWCGPCQALAPRLEEAAESFQGNVRFAKVDVDTAGEIASRFGIRSIPCVILFKDGKEISRSVGLRSVSELKQWIASPEKAPAK